MLDGLYSSSASFRIRSPIRTPQRAIPSAIAQRRRLSLEQVWVFRSRALTDTTNSTDIDSRKGKRTKQQAAEISSLAASDALSECGGVTGRMQLFVEICTGPLFTSRAAALISRVIQLLSRVVGLSRGIDPVPVAEPVILVLAALRPRQRPLVLRSPFK